MSAPALDQVDIYVREHCGAYVTNTVRKQRASCTHSRDEAARRLALKLFGARLVAVELVGHGEATRISRYQARGTPA